MIAARPTLVVANLVVAALAVWPWLPERAHSQRVSAVPGTASDVAAVATLPSLASLTATVERPLFAPSRRAPPTGAAPLINAGIESRYRLRGLAIAGAARRALVAEIASGRTIQVGVGDSLDGWTVTRIEQDRVILSSSMGEATLGLKPRAAPVKP